MTVTIGISTQKDRQLLERVETWLSRELGCVFGRREFLKERYCIALVGNADEFEAANETFGRLLRSGTHSSCIYVFRDACAAAALETASEATAFLRHRLLARRNTDSEHYSQAFRIGCPVTRVEIDFTDFDLVGFYPQAGNEDDPLYDPSNYAPFLCINQASDLFGFSLYVREMMDRTGLLGAAETCDRLQLDQLLQRTRRAWHDMAARTIGHFGKNTNPQRLCPAFISTDGRYYVTPHDEAEFGETRKERHVSEMPGIYLERLIDEWQRHLEEGVVPRLRHVVRPAVCPFNLGGNDAVS